MPASGDSCRATAWAGASLAALAALCVLGVLVRHGTLGRVDAYAVRHLMPFGSAAASGSSGLFDTLFAYPTFSFHLGGVIRIPASAGASFLLALLCAAVLWRRGRRFVALLWLAALAAANVAEGLGKLAVVKPPLYAFVNGTPIPAGFHRSFPSGHATRAALLAAIATTVWPRLWPVFAGWVVAVIVSAELNAIHTPSDIAGGLLLAAAVIFAVLAVRSRFEVSVEPLLHRGWLASTRAGPLQALR